MLVTSRTTATTGFSVEAISAHVLGRQTVTAVTVSSSALYPLLNQVCGVHASKAAHSSKSANSFDSSRQTLHPWPCSVAMQRSDTEVSRTSGVPSVALRSLRHAALPNLGWPCQQVTCPQSRPGMACKAQHSSTTGLNLTLISSLSIETRRSALACRCRLSSSKMKQHIWLMTQSAGRTSAPASHSHWVCSAGEASLTVRLSLALYVQAFPHHSSAVQADATSAPMPCSV